MNFVGVLQVLKYFAVLLLLAWPLGSYIARVFEGRRTLLDGALRPVERLIYRFSGIDAAHEHDWKKYAGAILVFNLVGFVAVYLLQRLQGVLPLNPQHFPGVTPDSSFNTAASFATNTNWQGYGGETTMSNLTQMLGLGVQNFLSAATGMAVLAALIRGFKRRQTEALGNAWVDLTRSTTRVLLPLSFALALLLVGQGVVQTFSANRTVQLLQPVIVETTRTDAAGRQTTVSQTIT
ncbi:MAG TPA: potassium-transporting ATPase subunit KdpA, partial [Steroidobacteraceae bacterium]|nr:potassium-transporting ATPase subunit KdpA [Steroidobacteraceae bacterium]